MELMLSPKAKREKGEVCREALVVPEIDPARAERLAAIAKALGDPIRVQLLDVLRRHAGEVCVCELVALFDVSQPTVSHHLKVLRDAGLVASQKQGLWVYYRVLPAALDDLSAWLTAP
jgi:ArsR family transcriptional regulator